LFLGSLPEFVEADIVIEHSLMEVDGSESEAGEREAVPKRVDSKAMKQPWAVC
jgi:hypothetical protein